MPGRASIPRHTVITDLAEMGVDARQRRTGDDDDKGNDNGEAPDEGDIDVLVEVSDELTSQSRDA